MVIKNREKRNKYQKEYYHRRMKDPVKRQKLNQYYLNYYHTKIKTNPNLLARKHGYRKKGLEKAWEMVFKVYGRKCACCNESNLSFLSIHHIHNDRTSDRKTMGIKGQACTTKYLRGMALQNDKKKYEILCYNCHYGIHQNNGTCPHKIVLNAIK